MRILHIAPHFGGGIAPATVGIIEATGGVHELVNIEVTRDSVSLEILIKLGIKPNDISWLCQQNIKTSHWDLIIFHFWSTDLWLKLASVDFICQARGLILLNHQAFKFNGRQALLVGSAFDSCVQSGFLEDGLPKSWFLIPTCRSESVKPESIASRQKKAIYIGTLDYKKLSREFFPLANHLLTQIQSIEIYGNLINKEFEVELQYNQSPTLKYCGYATDKKQILSTSMFFFYPLKSNHYGTTESSLLEAMLEGAIPLVKDNSAEAAILGKELFSILNLDYVELSTDIDLFQNNFSQNEISSAVHKRALELTDIKLRVSQWRKIFENAISHYRFINLSAVCIHIVEIEKLFHGHHYYKEQGGEQN